MILDELAAHARQRVQADKERKPLEILQDEARALPKGAFAFEQALRQPGLSFICEIKRASPSKGLIAPVFPYREIAREYEAAGADCISVLTEPKWFLGSDEIFTAVRETVRCPMIRKDFTVDAYQIYQAKCLGADAVLLICALLDTATIAHYCAICQQLGLTALVETHNVEEIQSAVQAGATVIGVNNRDLTNFTVDFSHAARLRDHIPPTALFVAESGVSSAEDVTSLRQIGADAVLVGEYLMRSDDKARTLREMRERAQNPTFDAQSALPSSRQSDPQPNPPFHLQSGQ